MTRTESLYCCHWRNSKGIIVGESFTKSGTKTCILYLEGLIWNRSNGKSLIKDKIVSQIELNIPTFVEKNLPDELSKIKPVKPGSRNL